MSPIRFIMNLRGETSYHQTRTMKLLLLLLVGALATPAHANLQQTHQEQQNIQNQRDARRADLCENHLRQAQFIQPQNQRHLGQSYEVYWRVSRGDLYQINWYGYENNGPLRPKPCAVTLLKLNEDFAQPNLRGYIQEEAVRRVRSRYSVEGDQLVRYSNTQSLSWNPQNPNPAVSREVVGVKR